MSARALLSPRQATLLLLSGGCLLALPACNVTSRVQNAEGVRQYQQGYYQGALQRFQQAIYNDPQNADSYYNLAAVYHQLGKIHQRSEDLVQAENDLVNFEIGLENAKAQLNAAIGSE